MYGNAWSTCNDSRDPSRRLRLRKGGTITSRFQARSADFSPRPPQRAKAQYRSTNADKKAASCHDGLTTTLIWQGGYDDRNRQGNRRTRPTTYGRKGAGPETDHTMCHHQSHAEKDRTRPCVSALAQMVHGLVRDWPGTVLFRLLSPDLPLAATVLPWRDSGPSTLCEARKRLGVAPLRWLMNKIVQLKATLKTPEAFYRGMRLTAVDGFVLDVPD